MTSGERRDAETLLARIARGMAAQQGGQIVHVAQVPQREARYAVPNPPLPAVLRGALSVLEVARLYTHQVEALERARRGENLVVVTSTSSGKTLCYNLPVLEAILQNRQARALYLYPINALVNDQFKTLARMNLALGGQAAAMDRYTGSVSPAKRREIRARQPNILLTNPELLHLSFLQWHHLWPWFWRNLAYIVVDEIHTYRGVFGAHVAHLFQRLLRVARHYGADPRFICCSATIANPQELAERLTSQPFSVISREGAARGKKLFVIWNPPLAEDQGANVRRSYAQESVDLLRHCLESDLNTIVFTRARRLTEQMARLSKDALAQERPVEENDEAGQQITSYRAGYLAQEREAIEARLKSGELRGVITTNALELGIDIGGLDAAIIAGYPGTIMSTWQQAGRAGRRGRDALVFLVASQNPLDQYYVAHPEQFHTEPHERAVVDLANPFIRLKHLLCAARELPWADHELRQAPNALRQAPNALRSALGQLCAEGLLAEQRAPGGELRLVYPEERRGIHMQVSLRSAGQESYRILDAERNDIGSIEPPNVFREAHPGAIYQHSDGDYRVVGLNRGQRTVHVRPESAPHYTRSRSTSSLRIVAQHEARQLAQGLSVSIGEVLVTETVRSFHELELGSNRMVRRVNLDTPLAVRLQTTALWLVLPPDLEAAMEGDTAEERRQALGRGLHAVEHLLAALLPLLVMCDRRDVDGHHELAQPDLDGSVLFLYDAYEGGIGLVEAAYGRIEELLAMALDAVVNCTCLAGCPSCIQSSGCRLGNENLDKGAAIWLLRRLRQQVGRRPQADSTRQTVGPAAHGELSMRRALEEMDRLTRQNRLEDHMLAPEPERPAACLFAEGNRVAHSVYGRGVVLSARLQGGTEQVMVRFAQRGGVIKTVIASELRQQP
jgi:DEAD/DEAH box helicase domain-containing protein